MSDIGANCRYAIANSSPQTSNTTAIATNADRQNMVLSLVSLFIHMIAALKTYKTVVPLEYDSRRKYD